MASQRAIQPRQKRAPEGPVFVEAEKLFEQMNEFSNSIARRAYELFEARGRQLGNDQEDWFRAESELIRSVPIEVKEYKDQIKVRAQVPGFAANEIKIGVEPKFLVISGKSEKLMEENKQQTVLSEFGSIQFCRELRFSTDIDPAKATGTLKKGVLELVLGKAVASTKPVSKPKLKTKLNRK
jgi:HSP20 family protein